jgi:hypothetical protein
MKTRGKVTTTGSTGSLEQTRRTCQEARCVYHGWINDNPMAISRCGILPNGLAKHYDGGLRLRILCVVGNATDPQFSKAAGKNVLRVGRVGVRHRSVLVRTT